MAIAPQRLRASGHSKAARRRRQGLFLQGRAVEALEQRLVLSTLTWTGDQEFINGNSNWSAPLNWAPQQAPANGDSLVFPSNALAFPSNNDLSNLSVNSITFSGGSYNLTGNALTLGSGGVSVSSGASSEIISTGGLALGANTTFNVNGGSNLSLNTPLSGGSGQTLDKFGTGTVVFNAPSANTYAGTTTIDDGSAYLAGGGNASLGGPLVVGNGDATPATVVLQSGSLGSSPSVTVNSDGTLVGSNSSPLSLGALVINGGTVNQNGEDLTASSITFNGGSITSSAPFTGQFHLGGNITVNGGSSTASINSVNLDLMGQNRTVTVSQGSAPNAFDFGGTASNGTLIFAGPGQTRISGNISGAGTQTINTGQTLVVDGIAGNILLNGGTLKGTGTVGTVTSLAAGGTISPGDSPGILNTGSLNLNPATTITVELNGPAVGTQYDQINVTGTVNLGGATLNILPGYAPSNSTHFQIINNDGADPIIGTFANFPVQNVPVIINGTQYFITYNGGDGNDVTLTVNGAPTAINDVYALPEGLPFSVDAASGVLANDTDPNGDKLQAVLVTGPTHGTLTLNGDGSFTYVPSYQFTGTDTFTYYATDGYSVYNPPAGSNLLPTNLATVTLYVNAVNETPVTLPDNYSANQVITLTVPASQGVLANDYSPDGKPITAKLIYSPQQGNLTFNADGSFSYTPNPGFSGTDTFAYTATDGNLTSNPTLVSISVAAIDRPPVAVNDAFSVSENQVLTVSAPGVLGNDTDPDPNSKLSASLLTGPAHGSLTLNSDGSFVYTPTKNYFGSDSFTYQTSDGTLVSAPATVTLTVNNVPLAPTAVDHSYTTQEDAPLTIALPGLLFGATNPDPGTPTITVVNGPQHGTLTTAANGSFVYTPVANYNGPDSFSYFLTNSGLDSNLATVSITVQPVPDAPVGVPDTFTVSEDSTLSVPGPGVLLNDVNVDKDALRAVLFAAPAHGSLAFNNDGSFVYTPDKAFSGTDTFTYRPVNTSLPGNVTTVTINVAFKDEAPVANNDVYTTERDQTLNVPAPGVLGNDADADGPTITAVLVNTTQHGTLTLNADGSFRYAPNPQYQGPTDSFTYKASDGTLLSGLATVTINITNVPFTTVMLTPRSDSGISNTDRITNVTTPTFVGQAGSNLSVALYAQAQGAGAPTVVGTAVADGAGHYMVTSSRLADGHYEFFVEAFHSDGLSTGRIDAGPLLIDTVGPRIVSDFLNPRTGQIYVTFQDDASGLSQGSLTDINNYSFTRLYSQTPRSSVITSAQLESNTGPANAQTVILTTSGGRRIIHGQYLFAVVSGGITDVAGNALDGEFNGTLPSGNGVPGGNFYAAFYTNSQNLAVGKATNQFVPILNTPTVPGPRGSFTAKNPPHGPVNGTSGPAGTSGATVKVSHKWFKPASHHTRRVPAGPHVMIRKHAKHA